MGFFQSIQNGIRNFASKTSKKINMSVLGNSGTKISSGIFDEEYRSELKDLASRMEYYSEMHRSDAAVAGSLATRTIPLISAKFNVAMPNGKKKNQKAVDFITDIFLNPNSKIAMKNSFKKFMTQAVTCKGYGFSAFEKIFAVKQNMIVIDEFAPRLQRSCKWNTDEIGNIIEIEQQNLTNVKIMPKIPIEKMLIITNDQEGTDLEGKGLFRQQYRPWKAKKMLINNMNIGFERFLCGLPEGKLPEKQEGIEGDFALFERQLKGIRSHQNAFMLTPFGYEFNLHEANMQGATPALNYMRFLNEEIFMAAFAQWALSGIAGNGGNRAMSTDHTDFNLMLLQADLDNICEELNKVIREIVYINFGETVDAPQMTAIIKEEDYQQTLDNVIECTKSGILPVYPELQEVIAEQLNMPAPAQGFEGLEEEKKALAVDISGNANGQDGQPPADGAPDDKKTDEATDEKVKTKRETHACGHLHSEETPAASARSLSKTEERLGGEDYFKEYKNLLDVSQEEFLEKITPIIKAQQKSVIAEITNRIVNNRSIDDVSIPQMNKYTSIVFDTIFKSAKTGVDKIAEETGSKANLELVDSLKDWADKKSVLIAMKHESDMKFFIGQIITDARLKGQNITEPAEALSDRFANQVYRRILETFNLQGVE